MTVLESLDELKKRYINYYVKNVVDCEEDARYSWWERERNCQVWCSKEGTYVPMSVTKTLNIMREWFKEFKK